MKLRPFLILAAIVAIVVGAAIWFLQSQPAPTALPEIAAPAPPASTPAPPPVAAPSSTRPAQAQTGASPSPAKKAEPPPLAEWEHKIEQVLRSNAGETETAQMLINMVPSLPAEGQAEAAQHISNLILDKDYNRVLPLLRNTGLSEELHDVLITDLMNREDQVKLPTFLEVAKIPNHPHHDEVMTNLQIFLDEDYGTDWAKWERR